MVLYYMLVSNIRTDEDLERLQTFQAVSIASILLLAIFELNHPGGAHSFPAGSNSATPWAPS